MKGHFEACNDSGYSSQSKSAAKVDKLLKLVNKSMKEKAAFQSSMSSPSNSVDKKEDGQPMLQTILDEERADGV